MKTPAAFSLPSRLHLRLIAALLCAGAAHAALPASGARLDLRSLSTGGFLVAWGDGAAADVHASAAHADERAAVEIADAADGVAIRSSLQNRYWRVPGTQADVKVAVTGTQAQGDALFTWVENADGTVSLLSQANHRYLSVVKEDSVIVPQFDSAALAGVRTVQGDSAADPSGMPSLVITPEMLKPYPVSYYVLHASAAVIGEAEKFRIAPPSLAKQAAGERLSKTLTFMYGISGKRTIGGIHNREPNSNPARWTNWINTTAGKYPGLWGGDFLFESDNVANRGTMISQAKAQWAAGAVVSLMYHMCPPTQGEACGWSDGVQSKLSNDQWTQLITDGTPLNATFKQRLKSIGTHFKTLQDAGVEVLFRPFHEMNQGAFWWGGRTGPNGTARLYQITHDYLVETMGLTNVFFVWSVQDLSWNFQDYNPGEKYWDVMSLDVYNGDGFTAKKYNAMLDVAGPKLIAIAETARIPTAAELLAQPRWSYFSGWSELTQQNNSAAAIQATYTASNTVSRDEMPGWANVVAAPAPNTAGILDAATPSDRPSARPAERAAASMRLNPAARTLEFDLAEAGPVSIALYHSDGSLASVVFDGNAAKGAHTASLARSAQSSGIASHGVFFVKFAIRGGSAFRKITLLE